MRCLWITREYPLPANSGELIYSRGLIRSLAAQPVELTLLSHDRTEPCGQRLESASPIREIGVGPAPAKGLKSLFSDLPRDAHRLKSVPLVEALRRELRCDGYDVVIADQAAMGWIVDEVYQLPSALRPVVVYISHNREAEIRSQIAMRSRVHVLKRIVLRYDAWKYGRLERRLCRSADLITAITPEDRCSYAVEYPRKPVIELTPGYEPPSAPERTSPIGPEVPRRVLLVGSFEWVAKRHNLDAFLKVAVPVLRANDIEIQVVGKASEAYVNSVMKCFDGVVFERNVPAIEPYLGRARMGLIAETVGGGFKLKTLDYVFQNVPIAALKDALGGVDFEAGKDAIIAASLPELVENIVARIDDFEFLNSAAERALQKFSNRIAWLDRGSQLYEALQQLAKQPKADRAVSQSSLS